MLDSFINFDKNSCCCSVLSIALIVFCQEDELKKGEMEADKDRMMRDYRAQLDADRARKLAAGRNHSDIKLHSKKGRTIVQTYDL